MKTTMKTWIGLMLMALVVWTGCKKDPDDPDPTPTDKVTNYFTLTNGTESTGDLPAASTSANRPRIDSVIGNSSVVAGSGNTLRVYFTDPQSDASQILIGVENVKGYFSISAGSGIAYKDLLVMINESITKPNFTVKIAVKDAAGNISAYYEISVHLITDISDGQLEVTLSWDRENDLDLHLVEPGGEEIYYGNATSANGGALDHDSNAGCSIDSIKVEHITYPTGSTVAAGTYTVRVDFWSDCSVTSNTNYVVTAKLDGALITAATGANPATGSFAPGTDDGGGYGSGETVMTFNVTPTNNSKVLIWRFEPINYVNTK